MSLSASYFAKDGQSRLARLVFDFVLTRAGYTVSALAFYMARGDKGAKMGEV